jgi:hypothetical protein
MHQDSCPPLASASNGCVHAAVDDGEECTGRDLPHLRRPFRVKAAPMMCCYSPLEFGRRICRCCVALLAFGSELNYHLLCFSVIAVFWLLALLPSLIHLLLWFEQELI